MGATVDRPTRACPPKLAQRAKEETPGTKFPVKIRSHFAGGHRIRVTPVPIPNTEVKPDTADGTARETVWESRSLPALFSKAREVYFTGLFLFVLSSDQKASSQRDSPRLEASGRYFPSSSNGRFRRPDALARDDRICRASTRSQRRSSDRGRRAPTDSSVPSSSRVPAAVM